MVGLDIQWHGSRVHSEKDRPSQMRLTAGMEFGCGDPARLRLHRVELRVFQGETVGEASIKQTRTNCGC